MVRIIVVSYTFIAISYHRRRIDRWADRSDRAHAQRLSDQ